ncbi:MAG: translation initiation factor IF-1 [Polaribacter sp.]|jgi:translation initiation factor IF-1
MILSKKGKITKIIDRYSFMASLEGLDEEVFVTVSKCLKIYEGEILKLGDLIYVDLSPYDLTRGRLHRKTFLSNK